MADKQEQQVQTALRLGESVLERADKLAERISQPGLRLTRADLLRMAVHRGLDQIEAENKKR
jgi:predicted DNA-binding protein